MSKRIYLPELKRIVINEHRHLTVLHGDIEGREVKSIPKFIFTLDYPEDCNKYEVRYRQHPKGRYYIHVTRFDDDEKGIFAIRENGTDIHKNLCCFAPRGWEGKRFNRYVKVLQ